MSVTKHSVFLHWLAAVWAGLGTAWGQSAVGRWCGRRAAGAKRLFGSSVVCRVLGREGKLSLVWEKSLLCRVLTWLFALPSVFCAWVYRKGEGVWSGSLLCRALLWLGHRAWLLMGLVLLVMLVAPHEMWNNVYALVLVLGVAAFFFIGAGSRPDQRLEVNRLGPYMIIYMGFICYGLLSSFSPSLSLRFFIFHAASFLIVLLTVSTVRSYRHIHGMLGLAAAGLALASLYGCYQGIIGVEVVASQQDVVLNKDMPGRIYSFFDNPNNFAEILVMLIPLLLALLLNSKTIRGKVFSALALVPALVAIAMTYSRSGWIGLCLAVFIFLAFQNWRFIPGCIVVGLCAIPFLPETIVNRILTIGNTKDTSTLYRFSIYEATFRVLKDYGMTGVGLGNDVMEAVFRHYPTLYDGNYPIHTHNNYFQMWGEVGFFGLLSYLALLGHQLKSAVRAFRASANREVRNVIAAAVAALCGILVISIAEYTWFYPRNMFLFWFLFGIIAAGIKLVKTGGEE